MKNNTEKWRSPSLGKEMELRIYGNSGTPILAIPTRGEKSDQWEVKGITKSISFQLESGFNQLYCIESADDESFFNQNIPPQKRIMRHQQYESYIMDEIVPFIKENNPIDFLIVLGVDMGGYHALNLSLKHPGAFGKAVGLSGIYDISSYMDGYDDDDVYYNNPLAFLPNLDKGALLRKIRQVDFRLVSYRNDLRKEFAYRLSDIMKSKMIDHQLDVWQMDTDEEWDLWRQMLKVHIV